MTPQNLEGGYAVKEMNVPICGTCPHMRMIGRARRDGNNGGNPRGDCVCGHPDAEEAFHRVCPRSPRMAGFIGFTPMGGDKPQIKTSPRWCPLRETYKNLC